MLKHPKTTLVIDQFAVPVQLVDDFACGGVYNQFTVSISASTRGLTKEGFVIEVKGLIESVKEAFAARGRMLKASCEELAGGVLHIVHREVGKRLVAAEIEVDNVTGHVALSWQQGQAVPSFPREATREEVKKTEAAKAAPAHAASRSIC